MFVYLVNSHQRNDKSKTNAIRDDEPRPSHPNNQNFPGVLFLNDLRGRVR